MQDWTKFVAAALGGALLAGVFDHGAGSGVLGHAEDVAGQDAEDQCGDRGEREADGGGDAGGGLGLF